MSQYRRLMRRLYAVRLLRLAKKRMKYQDLENLLGIDSTLLARYVSGKVIPGPEQTEKILSGLQHVLSIEDIIRAHIESMRGYIDLAPILSDIDMLNALAFELSSRYEGDNISKVLVPETSGIGLASLIASILNADLAVARRRKENPLAEYVEEHLVVPPNIKRTFYLRRNLLEEGDRVLIVDDIVHTGFTLRIMRSLIEKSKAALIGIASIVVVGWEWRKVIGQDVRVETVLYI